MKKKVAFYTLGCKLNYSETSTIGRMFEENGFEKVEFTDTPDIFIINTCSVTDNADKKCKKIVKEAKKISPNSFVTIIGCYAQLKPVEISSIKGVDAVLGAAEKFRVLDILKDFTKTEKPQIFSQDISETIEFNNSYSYGDRTRTFLKVQDGCNYSCTFCTIPLARGISRSDSINNIVNTAIEIGKSGVREIVLTGVNIGDFGIINGERKETFIDLITLLDQLEGIDRFRISSIEPNLLTNEIIDFVAKSRKFVPHFHIPLQSGNNEILKLMRRRYQRELYKERIDYIKKMIPHCCIGVDVITGFPTESEEDFTITYEFLTELNVSYLHVFTYSERENTIAATMEGKVSLEDRNIRTNMLRILSEKKKRKFYEENLGRHEVVLFENDIENNLMHGFTSNYIKVCVKYDPILVNETMTVILDRINEKGIVEVREDITEVLSH